MAEEKNGLDIDDWLDDLEEDKSGSQAEEPLGDLDQSDIDALLGGGAEAPAGGAGDLDQSDIDALFSAGGKEAAPKPAAAAPAAAAPAAAGGAEEGLAELDQSDIDSLLSGGAATGTPAAAPADIDLDQSDIDDLFAASTDDGGKAAPPASDAGGAAPSQDDVDQLFSDLGEESGGAETVNFSDVVSTEAAGSAEEEEGTFGLPDDSGFDDDEFDFGDLPDIPDESTVGTAKQQELGGEDIFSPSKAAGKDLPDFLTEATADITQDVSGGAGKKGMPFALPVDMNKKIMIITALCLVLFVAGGGYFFLREKKQEPAVPLSLQDQQLAGRPVGQPVPEPAPNVPPMVVDSQLRMAQTGEAVPIELTAVDEDKDPLQFEIVTMPKYGRLSGDVPHLTYLPNKDFPGEDSFEFRVSDGRHTSNPAKVSIVGPEKPPEQMVAEKPKEIGPRRPTVEAKNIQLNILSTEPLVIDWKKAWARANRGPFTSKVSVEIVGKELRGTLSRLDQSRHRYVPDRHFAGREVIRYRFNQAGIRSKVRELVLKVALGDFPPELRLRPLAKAYSVGDSVVLDAGATRDDSPETLVFSWEQVSGVPVQMEALNDEASSISFVVPSTFYRPDMPKIVIRVTAIDQSGQRSGKDLEIATVSRRKSALWGFDNGDSFSGSGGALR
ncbi:Ig-like domain-containing protein [Thiovibrio sp. JS02]